MFKFLSYVFYIPTWIIPFFRGPFSKAQRNFWQIVDAIFREHKVYLQQA